MTQPIRIGTSGWNYDNWKGLFYPEDLPQSRWFSYYCRKFDTVEINNTFYQQPGSDTFDTWRQQAPSGFLYAVKAHRYITHVRRLKDATEALERFFAGVRRLKSHLGPILYQLPPNWKKNLDRLRAFAEVLPSDLTHVIEFRDRDWLDNDTYKLMAQHNLCLCVHDMLRRHPRRVTGAVVYVRFHGTQEKYTGKYSPSRLKGWAKWINDVAKERKVFVYFNNDFKGYSIGDAQTLYQLTSGGAL